MERESASACRGGRTRTASRRTSSNRSRPPLLHRRGPRFVFRSRSGARGPRSAARTVRLASGSCVRDRKEGSACLHRRRKQLVEEIKDRFADSRRGASRRLPRPVASRRCSSCASSCARPAPSSTVYKNSLTEIAMRELALPEHDGVSRRPDRRSSSPARIRSLRPRRSRPSPRSTRRSSSRAVSSRTRSSTPTASRPSRRCRPARSSSPSCSARC